MVKNSIFSFSNQIFQNIMFQSSFKKNFSCIAGFEKGNNFLFPFQLGKLDGPQITCTHLIHLKILKIICLKL